MSFYRAVEMSVMLAGLILTAWPIWRIRRLWISVPIGTLLSCWFLVISSALTLKLVPGYDGFGAGMTILFAPFFGVGYAVVLAGIRQATSSLGARQNPSEPPGPRRLEVLAGVAAWAGLLAFAIVLPFVPPPRTAAATRSSSPIVFSSAAPSFSGRGDVPDAPLPPAPPRAASHAGCALVFWLP